MPIASFHFFRMSCFEKNLNEFIVVILPRVLNAKCHEIFNHADLVTGECSRRTRRTHIPPVDDLPCFFTQNDCPVEREKNKVEVVPLLGHSLKRVMFPKFRPGLFHIAVSQKVVMRTCKTI